VKKSDEDDGEERSLALAECERARARARARTKTERRTGGGSAGARKKGEFILDDSGSLSVAVDDRGGDFLALGTEVSISRPEHS